MFHSVNNIVFLCHLNIFHHILHIYFNQNQNLIKIHLEIIYRQIAEMKKHKFLSIENCEDFQLYIFFDMIGSHSGTNRTKEGMSCE